jgi:UDP-N-acetylglucosamine 2-epimerase (non-hydrolysing)
MSADEPNCRRTAENFTRENGSVEAVVKSVMHMVGARPNFMKMAPVHDALDARGLRQFVVHTGQHYDSVMSEILFRDLDLPVPYMNLEVGSGTHSQQTSEVMRRFEPVVEEQKPDCVLVYGDVNSTMAGTLV